MPKESGANEEKGGERLAAVWQGPSSTYEPILKGGAHHTPVIIDGREGEVSDWSRVGLDHHGGALGPGAHARPAAASPPVPKLEKAVLMMTHVRGARHRHSVKLLAPPLPSR